MTSNPHSVSLQDAIVDEIFELLLEFFSVHAHSIAFPEVVLPAVVRVSNDKLEFLIISVSYLHCRGPLKLSHYQYL